MPVALIRRVPALTVTGPENVCAPSSRIIPVPVFVKPPVPVQIFVSVIVLAFEFKVEVVPVKVIPRLLEKARFPEADNVPPLNVI